MKLFRQNEKGLRWVAAVFLFNLVSRLVLIYWHPATYTDSILYMNALDQVRGTIILPAYPFAILMLRRIGADPLLAGRLVSILAASLAVFPLYGLTRSVYEKRAALFTILLYAVSPLIFRWSLRIFPHSLYSLFVLLFLYGIFKYSETGREEFLAGGIFLGGLAVLTYPTGLVLVPVAVIAALGYLGGDLLREKRFRLWAGGFPAGLILLGIIFFALPAFRIQLRGNTAQFLNLFPVKLPASSASVQLAFLGGAWLVLSLAILYCIPTGGKGWYRRPLLLIALTASFSSYVFLHVWQKYLARSFWYQRGMLTSYRSLAGRWELWLTHYLYSYPYIIVYPVALAALLGLIWTGFRARRLPRRWFWLAFYVYFLVGTFYALVVNKWWTPRYQYTLAVLALVPAGYGLSRLWGLKKPRWIGPLALILCLGGSLVSTSFVLYWSRDSFADISRSSLYLKDHFPDRRIFTDELLKTGFWAKRPLRGYTRRTWKSLRANDILVLHGWHTNLRTEFRYLKRFYELKVLKKFPVALVPLLADDVVDWAGKRLRRRANAPVVWEERFRKQHIESWILEIESRRDGEFSSGNSPSPEGEDISPLPSTEHATYFDRGVWEVKSDVKTGEKVRLEMAHARAGPAGSFSFVVYNDQDRDGVPDKLIARSPRLTGDAVGKWSEWEFTSPGGKLFVGSAWKLDNWVYYLKPPWPGKQLGEVMYYSRGGVPVSRASRITKLKISFPAGKPSSSK